MDNQLKNDMSVEEFCQALAKESGFSLGDIYNMEINEIERLTQKHFNKSLHFSLI